MDASTFHDATNEGQRTEAWADESEAETTRVFRPVDPRVARRQSLITQAARTTAALPAKGR